MKCKVTTSLTCSSFCWFCVRQNVRWTKLQTGEKLKKCVLVRVRAITCHLNSSGAF